MKKVKGNFDYRIFFSIHGFINLQNYVLRGHIFNNSLLVGKYLFSNKSRFHNCADGTR